MIGLKLVLVCHTQNSTHVDCSIVSMLKQLEKMLTNYAVPIAFINGDKLADLSLEFELEQFPTTADLLTVIVNREDVENIISRPVSTYCVLHNSPLYKSPKFGILDFCCFVRKNA